MSAVFARLVAELSKRSDVWIASYGEIAEWFTALGVDRIPAAERFA